MIITQSEYTKAYYDDKSNNIYFIPVNDNPDMSIGLSFTHKGYRYTRIDLNWEEVRTMMDPIPYAYLKEPI